MKLLTCFTISSLLFCTAKAQNYVLKNKSCNNCVLTSINNKVVLMYPENGRVINWLVLDSNLTEDMSTRVSVINDTNVLTSDFFSWNNSLLYVEQVRDKNGRKIYISSLNEKGERVKETGEILFNDVFKQRTFTDSLPFFIQRSGNSRYLLFYQLQKTRDRFELSGLVLDSALAMVYTTHISGEYNPALEDFTLRAADNSGNFYFFKYDYEDNYRLSTRLSAWQINAGEDTTRHAQVFIPEKKIKSMHITETDSLVCFVTTSRSQTSPDKETISFITYKKDFSIKGSFHDFSFDEKTSRSIRKTIKPELNETIYDYFKLDKVQLLGDGNYQLQGSFLRSRLMVTSDPIDTNVNGKEVFRRSSFRNPAPFIFKDSLPAAGNVAFMQNQLSGNQPRRVTLTPVYDYVIVDAVTKDNELQPKLTEGSVRSQVSNYSSWIDSYLKVTRSDQPVYLTLTRKSKSFSFDRIMGKQDKDNLFDHKDILINLHLAPVILNNNLVCFYRNVKSKEAGLIKIAL